VPDVSDFEPYVALERLEGGPSYDMYLARHGSLERLVWIKVLREHVPLSSPFAARLEREGQLLARLDHPNVIDIIDCVRRPPRLWLVLEAVDGWSLAEVIALLRRGGNRAVLDARGVAALGVQLARALAHTHAAGLLHGALWPQHVVVSKRGVCKLTGYFLAENLERQREPRPIETEPGAFEPAYLSPEQVREEPLDERSDLFSLGVVMYELLAGHRPFQAGGEAATARAIRRDAPEPLARENPDVSPELERIIQRCLEKQKERRFDSAGQLLRALEHMLGSEALADLNPMVARALGVAGLPVPSAAPSPHTREGELRQLAAARGLRQSLVALFSVSALLVLGGMLFHFWLDRQNGGPRRAAAADIAGERGELLVVADPWAHVFVDGQKLETTPFATPLQLSAGIHHVRLEHPNAAAERREIELAPGQRIVLDVAMKVRRSHAGPDAGVEQPLASPDAGAR
jgi:eukaryotic-like serine/threonine-protein kinase